MALRFMIPCRCCGVKTPEVDDFGKPLCPECYKKERLNNEYQEDLNLTAQQLDDKYNLEGDGEHPLITRRDWRTEVANKATISGYWVWVEHRLSLIGEDDHA